jgi:hypothetical protein
MFDHDIAGAMSCQRHGFTDDDIPAMVHVLTIAGELR